MACRIGRSGRPTVRDRTGHPMPVASRTVTDQPWLGDACSLVDAFRAGTLSPTEALDASLAAIEASGLNAFSHSTSTRPAPTAAAADVSLPFGGVPMGIKELEPVDGWPYTEASLVFADRIADHDSTQVDPAPGRRRRAGRPDHGLGVRRDQLHQHQAARHHPQPVGPRAHPGRVVGRFGGRRGRRPRSPSPAAATGAGRSASRPASPACSASRRPTGASPGARARSSPRSPWWSAACPARCGTRPAGSTCATASTPATP